MGYSLLAKKADAINKDRVAESIQLLLENFKEVKKEYKVYNVLNIGRLMEGEAFYHELNQYYNCVGFEVEIESQLIFETNGKEIETELENDVGFFSIWVGKSHSTAPINFDECYQPLGKAHRFDNGVGDHIRISEEILSLEEVQEIVKKHNLLG